MILLLAACIWSHGAAPAPSSRKGSALAASPEVAPPLGCETFTFDKVSPELWSCLKNSVKSVGVEVPDQDNGSISARGVSADYQWSGGTQVLSLKITGRPFFTSCTTIRNHVRGAIAECCGTTMTLVSRDAAREVWMIDQPDVKKAETTYPNIKLMPGDSVSVEAGGCAQTGGRGQTWRRYLDPRGPDSERLFHGLLKLPGMPAPVRLVDFIASGNSYRVPAGAGSSLVLGYEDDDYNDNGYWGPDNGIENQCKDVENAWARITIVRAPKDPVPPGGRRPPRRRQ